MITEKESLQKKNKKKNKKKKEQTYKTTLRKRSADHQMIAQNEKNKQT